MIQNKCKICRRTGTKIFLKGERCFSPKCAMVRKAYPPGPKSKKTKSLSEYGKELKEKQKLKNWYNLSEQQFSAYVRKALKKRGKVENAETFLIKELESRLDNVVVKLGWAVSHSQARELISHGHFLINNRVINIPSYKVKKKDKIAVKPSSTKLKFFSNFSVKLKKYEIPSWLLVNIEKLEAEIKEEPLVDRENLPAEISVIFEYYSK